MPCKEFPVYKISRDEKSYWPSKTYIYSLSYKIFIRSLPPSPELSQFTHGLLLCARSHTRWAWAGCCCGQTDTRACPLCCCSPAQTETVKQRLAYWYSNVYWPQKVFVLHYITKYPRGLTHPAVSIRVTGCEIRHGVQRQETRRTPAQVLTRITVILRNKDHRKHTLN